ncbi:M48 family metalloprotease [Alterisphingorhabdus coralli]|uniref:M48 family metalloprotease n=1 Tax=Alterisphingorhabdus coralli TaxID=3071408 RepID=A0AA97I1E7_9SPHN|nr:M48 family metalloprotease [Parasphingorhabdus sp. SCSIO 66989]WOE76669.1 M48 family metalloprotease [Parasphingorhabdus sp. SCSIO 66989]
MLAMLAQPAQAQSILRDAETEELLRDMSRDLIIAAGLRPGNVNVVVINDPSINAFVAGTQDVYIHSGLIRAADTANEVQGVIAHELGHIALGHSITRSEAGSKAGNISILSLILGAAAIAAGAGEAGMGIMGLGQQAAMSQFLSHTRAEEASADVVGAKYLSQAGMTGRGSINFFKKLQNLEFRLAIPQNNSFGRSHPLSGERITTLQSIYEKDPAWNKPLDQNIEQRFKRVKAKLEGFILEPRVTFRDYPEYDESIPARYARAYAWHKSAYPDKAMAEAEALLAEEPENPYFLELHGQILLESGKPDEALESLRKATYLTNSHSLIAGLFGHALIATEDDANMEEAEKVLKAAVARDARNPFAWYQLGVVYGHKGDEPRASLASAERYVIQGNAPLAMRHAGIAMAGLPEYSPDWIRAQDIAILARDYLERQGNRR